MEYLRDCVSAVTRRSIGLTTVKRVWGYIERGNFRTSTLEVLTRFLGYESWEHFLRGERTAAASRFYNGSTLWPSRELSKDDLRHDGSACRGYVCGRISGIHIRR